MAKKSSVKEFKGNAKVSVDSCEVSASLVGSKLAIDVTGEGFDDKKRADLEKFVNDFDKLVADSDFGSPSVNIMYSIAQSIAVLVGGEVEDWNDNQPKNVIN